MDVFQVETAGQLRHRVGVPTGLHQGDGPSLLSGRGVLVVVGVEGFDGPAGQEPAFPRRLGHAAPHRYGPILPWEGLEHPPDPMLPRRQYQREVGRAGQRHPAQDP